MDILSKREPIIREVAAEKGVEPELIVNLLGLEREFSNLHGYGARGKLRRAAEKMIDESMARQQNDDSA